MLVSVGVLREIPCVHCLLNSDAIENQYPVSPGLAMVLWLYGSRMGSVGMLHSQKYTVTLSLIPTAFKSFVLMASFSLKFNNIAFSVCIIKTLSVLSCIKKCFFFLSFAVCAPFYRKNKPFKICELVSLPVLLLLKVEMKQIAMLGVIEGNSSEKLAPVRTKTFFKSCNKNGSYCEASLARGSMCVYNSQV